MLERLFHFSDGSYRKYEIESAASKRLLELEKYANAGRSFLLFYNELLRIIMVTKSQNVKLKVITLFFKKFLQIFK